jgi:hypothetical protein
MAPTKPPGLYRDERGAVMVTGVFMATFLVGALWFIFGTARAAIFRERVQETADAAAFSSAVLHAKGMNLIAAINLVLFALTAVWLLIRALQDILTGIQAVVGEPPKGKWDVVVDTAKSIKNGDLPPNHCEYRATLPGVGAHACTVAKGVKVAREATQKVRETLGDQMGIWFPRLSQVQDVTAVAAPAGGAIASLAIGAQFKHFTIALSPSMIPVDALTNLARDTITSETGETPKESSDPFINRPLGLPVIKKKYRTLCNRTAKIVLGTAEKALMHVPVVGDFIEDVPFMSDAIGRWVSRGALSIANRYCGDKEKAGKSSESRIFGEHGPKGMFSHAQNGNDLMQIWAFTYGHFTDNDLSRVAVGARQFGTKPTTDSQVYIAQAEFYYDCTGTWTSDDCNGTTFFDNTRNPDNALFNMRWRARLRRFRSPNVGAELGRYLRDAVFSGAAADALKELLGVEGESDLSVIIDDGFHLLSGKVTDAAGIGNEVTGSTSPELIH